MGNVGKSLCVFSSIEVREDLPAAGCVLRSYLRGVAIASWSAVFLLMWVTRGRGWFGGRFALGPGNVEGLGPTTPNPIFAFKGVLWHLLHGSFLCPFLLCSTDEQHLRGTCGDLLHVEHSGGEATSTNLARTGLPSSREGIAFTLSALVTYEDCIPHPVGCNVDAGVDRTTGMEKN